MKYVLISLCLLLINCSVQVESKEIGSISKFDRYLDKEYNIMCYQSKYSRKTLSCVKLDNK